MAKLECPCGNVLSNVSDGNKVEFDCYDAHEESILNVWVCTCGGYVNVNNQWFEKVDCEGCKDPQCKDCSFDY